MAGSVGRSWKRRTKQCAICRKHFVPHPRVGDRQRSCGQAECRRELHQRARAAWREAHREEERAERLRERLRKELEAAAALPTGTEATRPRPQVDGAVVREVVGVDIAVIIDESLQVVTRWVGEVVRAEGLEIKREFHQVLAQGQGEAIGARAPPP